MLTRRSVSCSSVLVALSLMGVPVICAAGTPSFLCSKANSWIEKTICASDRLSEQDLELATVYARSLRGAQGEAVKSLEAEQRRWWGDRAQCQKDSDPIACVGRKYTTRIDTLKGRPDYPGDQPALGPKITKDAPIKEVGQGWSKNLSEYFKAIKVCVAVSPKPARSVLTAWKEERGETVAMWIQDDEDQNLLCLAARDGSKLIRLRLRDVDEDLPEVGPILYLGNTEPRGHCENPIPVLDPSGREFGWLAQSLCKS